MLPFLQDDKANQDGIAQQTRTPDKKPQENQEDNPGMEAAAHDLIRAIHARDSKAVAEALQSAFEIADSQPHLEGEHLDEEKGE